jgi:hypothetical protein
LHVQDTEDSRCASNLRMLDMTDRSEATTVMARPPARGHEAAPRTVVTREYRRPREYAREVARLRQDGWKVASVLERPRPRLWADWATGGLYSVVFPPVPERLVTYVWEGREPQQARPVSWLPPARRRRVVRRVWWIVVVVLLVALLVLGLLSFVVDVPGLPG